MKDLMKPYKLLILINIFFSQITLASNGIEKKVKYLFEVSPEKNPKYDIKDIKDFCEELKKYDNLSPKKRVKKVFDETK
jgi:hypothetical protein